MPKIVFDKLHIPVPTHLIRKLNCFKDGCLSVEGVRVAVFGTKMYFHVLSWSDVEVLLSLNVNLGEYFDVIRRHECSREEKLLLRRVQYSIKKQEVCSG